MVDWPQNLTQVSQHMDVVTSFQKILQLIIFMFSMNLGRYTLNKEVNIFIYLFLLYFKISLSLLQQFCVYSENFLLGTQVIKLVMSVLSI